MRDSIATGLKTMLRLVGVLEELGKGNNWQFVHIVLTDGQDTGSEVSLEDLGKLMLIIGKKIPVRMLKTYFIGVDIGDDKKAFAELAALRLLGGENAEIHNVSNMQVGKIFEKIKVEIKAQRMMHMQEMNIEGLKMIKIQNEVKPVLSVEAINYVVLFNMDMSGSMSGKRWTTACACANDLIKSLGSKDLVAGIVFNDKCKLLNPREYLQKQK